VVVVKEQRVRRPRKLKKKPQTTVVVKPVMRSGTTGIKTVGQADNAQMKALRKEFVKKAVPTKRKMNKYLATLLNPEEYNGIRYPDSYDRETCMLHGLIEFAVPFFENGLVEDIGSFYLIFRTSMVHPVWAYMKSTQVAGPCTMVVDDQTDRFGLFPLPGTLSPTEQSDQLVMQTGVVYNFVAPASWRNQDFISDPFIGTTSDKSKFYGYPLSGVPSGSIFRVTCTIMSSGASVAAGDTVSLYAVTKNGITLLNTLTLTANQQTMNVATAVDMNALIPDSTDPQLGRAIGRPGLGFRLVYNGVSPNNGTLQVTNISLFVYSSTNTYTTHQLALVPYDVPDLDSYLRELTGYRPVSGSIWCKFEGNTIEDGGNCAGALYQGGDHPNQIGIYNYASIAQLTGPGRTHEGKYRDGYYGMWIPLSTNDTSMRKVVNSSEWTHPYHVIAGATGNPTQPNSWRARIFINFEGVSSSQLWSYQAGKPSQAKIAQAVRVLRNGKVAMENPEHMKTIKQYLEKAMGYAKSFGNWVNDNKHWLIPAGEAAMMLL
jgi:hypothetical protein